MSHKKQRRFLNIGKLLETYRAIEKFQSREGYFPSREEVVKEGVSPSTSVIQYYFLSMETLNMLDYKRKKSHTSRLLPLDQASPIVLNWIKEHENG